jgi:hypothetical protein
MPLCIGAESKKSSVEMQTSEHRDEGMAAKEKSQRHFVDVQEVAFSRGDCRKTRHLRGFSTASFLILWS